MNDPNNGHAAKVAESEGEQLNLFCDIKDVLYCHTLLLHLTFLVLKILFSPNSHLGLVFQSFR